MDSVYTSVLSSTQCQSIIFFTMQKVFFGIRELTLFVLVTYSEMEERVGTKSVLILVTQHVKLNNFVANMYLTSTVLLSGKNYP